MAIANTQDLLAVSLPEAARRLGVSSRTVASLVANRELASRRIGRRRVIPTQALEDFLGRDHQINSGSTRAKRVRTSR